MWVQYTILYFHGVTNTVSLWISYLQPQILQGVKLDWSYIQTTTLCGIGKIIGDGVRMERAYLRLFLIVAERGTTVAG